MIDTQEEKTLCIFLSERKFHSSIASYQRGYSLENIFSYLKIVFAPTVHAIAQKIFKKNALKDSSL